MIYIETFTLPNFLFSFFKYDFLIKLIFNQSTSIYYFDKSFLVDKFIIPLLSLSFFRIRVKQLNFKMMDIRDENEELIRVRIFRVDLFEIKKEIVCSEAYKALYHETWEQGRVLDYVHKGVIDGGIMDLSSVSRVLFLIEVVHWHMRKTQCNSSLFILNKRPWFELYKKYAGKHKISLSSITNIQFKIKSSSIHKFIRAYPLIYAVLKNYKYRKIQDANVKVNSTTHRMFVEGRGDVNLNNNGEHSDFFWKLNSKFPAKNIIYKHQSDAEREYLSRHGIYSVSERVVLNSRYKRNYIKPRINFSRRFIREYRIIKAILASYDLDRFYWSSFFKLHNVKLWFSWYKYTNDHMAIADAINDNGGISIIWQMAFDGYESADCTMNVDVSFSYSEFSESIEKKQASKVKYNVITGYPKDYIGSLLKEKAKDLRYRLNANGAKKIVFVIDENSIDDDRWHTGHLLQRENYSYILEKVLETPWLGVIFKPKVAKTLRKRLGSVADLLKNAEDTGRCYIYESSGRHTTSAPPLLAGLSADICIHGHLSAGTAALECALEGLPTLLIDREGCSASKLYELPEGKVIFKDWQSTIDSVMKHFNKHQGISGFGDWSAIMNDLDSFQDGLAANRMGTYLGWLVQGFDEGLDKDTILANAAKLYQKQWSDDKVLIAKYIQY